MSAMLIDTSCYIHEIPLNINRVLSCQLDQNDRWQQLAQNIGFEKSVIEQIKQSSSSPATKVLSLWGQNHTVTELFMAFYRMKEFRLMDKLRDLVDSAYHRLIVSKSTSFASFKSQTAAASKPYNHLKKSNSSTKSDSSTIDFNPFKVVCTGIPQIAFTELAKATSEWNQEKVLGDGAFGTVYRGKWKCTEVAIKRINCIGMDKSSTAKKRLKQVMIEMRFLNTHRHDNILPLYGYSFDGSSACLVYQMMASGALDRRLRQKRMPLTYKQRLNIAIGTAKGLHFLHTFHKRPTVHGDIKSANILLDHNLQPKIGDFGLACQTKENMKSKRVYGTHAYLADDFISNLIISTKNDIFSFGVVLFELATSLRPYDERRGIFSKLSQYMWAVNERPERLNILTDAHTKSTSRKAQPVLRQLIEIGYSCTQPKANDRPEMSEILNSLLELS